MEKENNKQLNKMVDQLEKIDSFDDKTIIKESKHIGLGDNKVKGTKISKTDKDAIDQARFEKTKLGQPFVEPDESIEDINEKTLSLINKYMIDIFEIR